VRVKWPIAGASFVGAAAVISYVFSTPNPNAGEVIGLIAVTVLVIVAVLLFDRSARRTRTKP
jgi:hypothetical protein